MPGSFPDCYFCGGEVRESRIVREVWREGTLSIVEDVPAGVCGQCGEKYIAPTVARQMDALLSADAPPDHVVQVPAYSFHEGATNE